MKTPILTLVVFLLILASASGKTLNDSVVMYLPMNGTGTTITNVVGPDGTGSDTLQSLAHGIIGSTRGFDETVRDSINMSSNDNTTEFEADDPFCINLWLNISTTQSDNPNIMNINYNGAGSPYFQENYSILKYDGINLIWQLEDNFGEATASVDNFASLVDDTFTMVTLSYSPNYDALFDNLDVYINGVHNTTAQVGFTDGESLGSSYWTLGTTKESSSTSQDFTGTIDEVAIFAVNCTAGDAAHLYNGGAGQLDVINETIPSAPTADPGFVNLISPANQSQVNLDPTFYFNYTHPQADQCELYDNRTGTWARSVNFVSPGPPNTTLQAAGTGLTTQGNISWGINCTNSDGIYYSDNYTFFYDTVDPVLTVGPITEDNLSQQWENYTLTVNVTDPYLFAMRWEITDPVGSVLTNNSYNMTTHTWYNATAVINHTLDGIYTLFVEASDGHTAKTIRNYDNRVSDKELIFEDAGQIRIYPKVKADFGKPSITKQTDRYTFTFPRSTASPQNTFVIESTAEIVIFEHSPFKGHVIIKEGSMSTWKWVDFETANDLSTSIKRVTPNKVEVTVAAPPSGDYVFSSIGGLNVVNTTRTYLYNGTDHEYTEVYDPVIFNEVPTHYLLNLTFNPIRYANSSAFPPLGTFTFNETNITPTIIDNGTYYRTWRYNYTPYNYTTGTTLNHSWWYQFNSYGDPPYYYNTPTLNQTIASVILANTTNCQEGENVTINITAYYEDSPNAQLNVNYHIALSYWISDDTVRTNVSFNRQDYPSIHICLYPYNYTVRGDLYIQYDNNSGFTHRWYLYNHTFTNATENLSVYNFDDTTGISTLRNTLRKVDDYTSFEDVVTKLQRYYPEENGGVWRTVQMDQSGDFGLTTFHVYEQTEDYRFIMLDTQNRILRTTKTLKFSCDGTECDIVTQLDPLDYTPPSIDLDVNYTYDNDTSIVNITWNDPTGTAQNVRILVTKERPSGITTICSASRTGSSGYYECDTTGYEGMVVLEVLGSASPESLAHTFFIILDRTNLQKILIQSGIGVKESALWSFGILLTIVMSGAINVVAPVIGLIIGFVILSLLGTIGVLDMTFLFSAAIAGVLVAIVVRKK